MLGERLRLLARKFSLSRRLGWIRLFGAVGIILQIVIMGELLFFSLLSIYATSTGARVFRYMGY